MYGDDVHRSGGATGCSAAIGSTRAGHLYSAAVSPSVLLVFPLSLRPAGCIRPFHTVLVNLDVFAASCPAVFVALLAFVVGMQSCSCNSFCCSPVL